MAKITFEGSPQLQTKLKALVLEFIDVFAIRKVPADVEPMKIVVDREKWRLPCNRAPLGGEAEGDTKASGCTPEARRDQRVAGHGMEPGLPSTEAHT